MARFQTGAAAVTSAKSQNTARFWSTVDAEELIRDRYGIAYKRDGEELVMKCPLDTGLHKHGDRTGKFAMNTRKNVYGCWVCGGGTILDFIKQMERGEDGEHLPITDEQAIAIAQQYAHEITEEEFERRLKENFNDSSYRADTYVNRSEDTNLIRYWAQHPHPYWASRGLVQETQEMWSLGYDPQRNRVVVPHVFDGEYAGYLTRTLIDTPWMIPDKDPWPDKKWKNSWGLPKDRTLFNFDRASKYESVVVVEAAVSAVYLWQCGIPNVVALMGEQTPPLQVALLRLFDDVIIWPDADKAGWHGAKTIIDGLKGHSNTWIARCDEGDPNEIASGILRPPQECWDILYARGLTPGQSWAGV